MKEQKERMIRMAIEMHSSIRPCADRNGLDDCFTISGNQVIFWFNTLDNSTHVVIEEAV